MTLDEVTRANSLGEHLKKLDETLAGLVETRDVTTHIEFNVSQTYGSEPRKIRNQRVSVQHLRVALQQERDELITLLQQLGVTVQ